jgi:predicted dehydrogenase
LKPKNGRRLSPMPQTREIRLAVRDRDAARRDRVASRLRGAVVVPDDLKACDAVMLIGEPARVADLLAAGKSVLLVAEPCPRREVAEPLFAAAFAAGRQTGKQFALVNPDRYLPSRQLVRKQLLAGPLGEVGLVRLHRWESAAPDRAPDAAALPEQILRDLDVVLWLTALEPDRVYAVQQSDAAGQYVQVHLGFPGGAMALLDFDGRLPPGDGYQSLSVIAASGAAYANDHQNMQLLYRGGQPRAVRTEEGAGQLAAIAQEFVDTLRDVRDLTTASSLQWSNAFAVADAVAKSLATRKSVAM